jgi:hypothetical protein
MRQGIVLVAMLLLGACSGSSDSIIDPATIMPSDNIDILGLKLGSSFDSAKNLLNNKALRNSQYFEHERAGYIWLAGIAPSSTTDSIVAVFSPIASDHKLIAMERQLRFFPNQMPNTEKMEEALTSKFGNPRAHDLKLFESIETHKFVWLFRSATPMPTSRADELAQCDITKIKTTGLFVLDFIDPLVEQSKWVGNVKMKQEKRPFVDSEFSDFEYQAEKNYPCGVAVTASLDERIGEKSISSLLISVVDFNGTYAAELTERQLQAEREAAKPRLPSGSTPPL